MYQDIDLGQFAACLMHELPRGVLLTTKADGRVNTMTIGWGFLGIDWNQPTFVALVREGRYTNQMLREHGEFTVNVPNETTDRRILGLCGSRSGRDADKIAQAGLTLVEPRVIDVPGIRELPLTLECRVTYAQRQELEGIPAPLRERFYPAGVDSTHPGANRDAHVAYYAQVMDAYLIVD